MKLCRGRHGVDVQSNLRRGAVYPHMSVDTRGAASGRLPDWHFDSGDWAHTVRNAQVLYFGERHHQNAVRDAQLAVLREWASVGTSFSLVLEMFVTPQQGLLDNWALRAPAERELEYEASGGDFELSQYSPLVDVALGVGARVLAGFPPRAEARAACVAAGGVGGSLELTESLPGNGLADHFRMFAGMISAADLAEFDHDGAVPERGSQIFPAQCYKDDVCAKIVCSAARQGRVMLVAGGGHTDYGLGVPQRVQALAAREDKRPLRQCSIAAREWNEPLVKTFRGHPLSDLVVSYTPT